VDLPEELLPLSWLLGQWVGVGTGQYPTIEDFRFGQELSFTCDGRPFIAMNSRSWILDADGNRERPGAMESAYFRPRPDNEFEALFIHPTGYTEVWHGKVTVSEIQERDHHAGEPGDDHRLGDAHRQRQGVPRRTAAVRPGPRRRSRVDLRHGGGGEPLGNHLAAKLKRV
jgi:hypothetical protein